MSVKAGSSNARNKEFKAIIWYKYNTCHHLFALHSSKQERWYYTTLIKFGIGRATYDASQEIRNDKITREEGVSLVHKYDQEFPNKYFKEFYSDSSIN